MTAEQDIALAESAKAVLENEAFQFAFDTLTQELTTKWQNSPARDADGREKLYLMLKLTQKIRINLESLIVSGKMAQAEKARLSERLKSSWAAWQDGSE